jgi:hypothetical protein
LALLAKNVDCGFKIAIGFGEGLLAVHHPGAGHLAQFVYIGSSNAHDLGVLSVLYKEKPGLLPRR